LQTSAEQYPRPGVIRSTLDEKTFNRYQFLSPQKNHTTFFGALKVQYRFRDFEQHQNDPSEVVFSWLATHPQRLKFLFLLTLSDGNNDAFGIAKPDEG
jgi:hypothetical protein